MAVEQATIAGKKTESNPENDIVKECRESFNLAQTYTEANYRVMKEDLEFLEGEQWATNLKTDRREDGRPCLTINKLPTFLDQVVGDMRMNRPSIKIKPVDSGADKATAEILTGLIRCIEVYSNAAYAYDTGFDAAAACGFGAWRVITDYVDPLSFDQEIRIIPIDNQFTVYLDPNAKEWDGADGDFLIVTEMLKKEDFIAKYPKAGESSWDAARDQAEGWHSGERIRVAEYFKKEYEEKRIYLVMDKETFEYGIKESRDDFNDKDYELVKERDTMVPKIVWYRLSGSEILEGPQEYPGKYFPIIPIWGKKLNVEGRKIHRGIVRHAKDPQRLYNYNRSMSAEALSLAPRAPFLVTPKQIQNFEGKWTLANRKNYVYLPYNPDPQAPPPQRQPANPLSAGIQQEVIVSDQELHDTTGLQRSSLGKQSNEKSGKAILARQKEGDVGSFDYTNSLVNALIHTGKVVIDLVPHIYDTARVIRIIGEDGEDSQIPINQKIEEIDQIFDFSVGKYDVVVSTGPSFTTQREETRTSMMEFLQYVPSAGPLVADLVAKNMDWPGADQFAERLKPQGAQGDSPEEQAMAEAEMEFQAELKDAELVKAKAEADEAKAQAREAKAKAAMAEYEARNPEPRTRTNNDTGKT